MIWAILAFLGVPLWVCALGLTALVFRTRAIKGRPGNMTVRVRRPGRSRWTRANAIWVSDVFVWRASPAAWAEDVRQVSSASPRPASPEEAAKLHRLGDGPALLTLTYADGATMEVAAPAAASASLLGPFPAKSTPTRCEADRIAPRWRPSPSAGPGFSCRERLVRSRRLVDARLEGRQIVSRTIPSLVGSRGRVYVLRLGLDHEEASRMGASSSPALLFTARKVEPCVAGLLTPDPRSASRTC
jgi:hypothetical protein